MQIRKVTIVGLGLIGGSWGMALKRTRPELEICGVDIDGKTIQTGIETKAIDWGTADAGEGVRDTDLVVLATLGGAIPNLAEKIFPCLKPGCIVTDVGSTKGRVTGLLAGMLPPEIHYIGGHPMAGSEAKGISGADSYLFENAVYILTPLTGTDREALKVLEELIKGIGARVLHLSPRDHDQMVAAISHLPHVAAAALVNAVGYLEEQRAGIFQLAAGGFRDVTRIADSQPEMWRDIFLENRETVLSLIKVYRQALAEIEQAIDAGEETNLFDLLNQAQDRRRQIPAKIKGLLPEIHEIVVTVPDRPGIIGSLAIILGKEAINIIDIEILRVREGEGGTIRFGFQTAKLAQQAVAVLRDHGFIAKARS